jgi:hypothetical protein
MAEVAKVENHSRDGQAKLRKPYLIFLYWPRMACALRVAYTCMFGVANIQKLSFQVEETQFNLFTVYCPRNACALMVTY